MKANEMSSVPIVDMRAVNFYKFVDGVKVYRYEIQFRRLGSPVWTPIECVEREDFNITVPEVDYHLREYPDDRT